MVLLVSTTDGFDTRKAARKAANLDAAAYIARFIAEEITPLREEARP